MARSFSAQVRPCIVDGTLADCPCSVALQGCRVFPGTAAVGGAHCCYGGGLDRVGSMSGDEYDMVETSAMDDVRARLDAVSAMVAAAGQQPQPSVPSNELGFGVSASSHSSGAAAFPARDRSRSRDRDSPLPNDVEEEGEEPITVDRSEAPLDNDRDEAETSYGDISSLCRWSPEPPRTCGCDCYRTRSRNLGPRGGRSRRCSCPLCGHHGCHRRIRLSRGTPSNVVVFCQECGPLCVHLVRRFGVCRNRERTTRCERSTRGPPPWRANPGED